MYFLLICVISEKGEHKEHVNAVIDLVSLMGKKKVAKKASGAGRASYPEVDERGCGEEQGCSKIEAQ